MAEMRHTNQLQNRRRLFNVPLFALKGVIVNAVKYLLTRWTCTSRVWLSSLKSLAASVSAILESRRAFSKHLIESSVSDRSIARNALLGGCAQAASVLMAVFLTPMLIWCLGLSVYGLWMLVTSIVGYFGMTDLGFGHNRPFCCQAPSSRINRSMMLTELPPARFVYSASAP